MSLSQTADALVFSKEGEEFSLLLIKRGKDPYKDHWAFPGGFLEKNESPLEGCLRELFEETGLVLESKEAIALTPRSRPGRDPRGEVQSFPFLFYLKEGKEQKAGDDAKEAEWVKLQNIESLAFDHGAILLEALGKFWPFMPSFEERFSEIMLPSFFLKDRTLPEKAIFYGGTFNPFHEGHKTCLQLCKAFSSERIIVVPDSSPWKSNELLTGCAFKRYKTLCQELQKSSFEIYPSFWGMEKTNPTVDWLPFAKLSSKSLLMGDDTFMEFYRWKESEKLQESLTSLYVVPRNHSVGEIEAKKRLYKVEVIILPEHSFQKLSSTGLRKKT